MGFENSKLEQIPEERKISFKEYIVMERKAIKSPKHIRELKEKLGHEPTRNELAEDFVVSGLAKEFSDKWRPFVKEQLRREIA